MIPLALHMLWLNDDRPPAPVELAAISWLTHAPSFNFKLWTRSAVEDRYPKLDWERPYNVVSNEVRVRLLHELGGIYVDADMTAKPGVGEAWEDYCSCAPLLAVRMLNAGCGCDNTPMGAMPLLDGFLEMARYPVQLAYQWNRYLFTADYPAIVLPAARFNAEQDHDGAFVLHARGSLKKLLLQ